MVKSIDDDTKKEKSLVRIAEGVYVAWAGRIRDDAARSEDKPDGAGCDKGSDDDQVASLSSAWTIVRGVNKAGPPMRVHGKAETIPRSGQGRGSTACDCRRRAKAARSSKCAASVASAILGRTQTWVPAYQIRAMRCTKS